MTNLDLDNFCLLDFIQEKNRDKTQQYFIAIGRKTDIENQSKICISITKPYESEPSVNYFSETSEYLFTYPCVTYCKGNTELFI